MFKAKKPINKPDYFVTGGAPYKDHRAAKYDKVKPSKDGSLKNTNSKQKNSK